MYVGMEDVLRTRYPSNIIVSGSDISDIEAEKIEGIINEQTTKANFHKENIDRLRDISFLTLQDDANFILMNEENYSNKNGAGIVKAYVNRLKLSKDEKQELACN